jgi:hypothetical protein
VRARATGLAHDRRAANFPLSVSYCASKGFGAARHARPRPPRPRRGTTGTRWHLERAADAAQRRQGCEAPSARGGMRPAKWEPLGALAAAPN